jgi:hypothetical protein
MVYAYLQQGRDEAARAVIAQIAGNTTGYLPAGMLATYNTLAMQARYALERNDWKAAAALKPNAGPPSAIAVTHFARGLGAARAGDAAAANADVEALNGLVAQLTRANDNYWALVVAAQARSIEAWVAHLEGRHADALRMAREAADQEEKVEKHPVTPGPLIPARELLGDILLVHNRPAEALVAYEATLKREPNRARTLYGAAKAARAAGQDALARTYYGELLKLLDPASKRPELTEARQALGQ